MDSLEHAQDCSSDLKNTRLRNVAVLSFEVGLEVLAIPWHDHVGEQFLALSHQISVEDHSVVNNLRGGVLVGAFVLLSIYFPHGIYLSSELFIVIGNLENEGSVLVEMVNALVDLAEGSAVDKSTD